MLYTRAAELLSEHTIEYAENEPLAPHTSFRIGGPARLAVYPDTVEKAVTALSILRNEGARILVLGNGTNVLIADEGFDGAAVILTGMHACELRDGELYCEAGVSLTRAAMAAAKLSLSGLEFAYGIPGTIGGGVYMNAGAYGGEMSQVVRTSTWYDLATGESGSFKGDAHDFAYRHSAYMNSSKIVLSASLRLKPGVREDIEAVMNDYMSRRRAKQPLEYPNAGSIFKRGADFFTAQLIDEAGLKGRSVGGAQVSEKHAGFIVNRGGATARDVLTLIDIIKTEIKEKFDKEIECEVRYIH